MSITWFATAYDPLDLPGTSIDPLGFERAYLYLADRILPDLTNAADRPRYFALLCAGSLLAQSEGEERPIERYDMHRDCVLRLERAWVLANVLAQESRGDGSLIGLRGIRAALAHRDRALKKRSTKLAIDYQLLKNQVRYGAIGTYAATAERLGFLDRRTFDLRGEGEVLAEAFIKSTRIPSAVKDLCLANAQAIARKTLRAWGHRAPLDGPYSLDEARCFGNALRIHPVRERMIAALRRTAPRDDEPELLRLRRVRMHLAQKGSDPDLILAVRLIEAFERCYAHALFAFERLLWLCRVTLPARALDDDPRISAQCADATKAVQRFCKELDRWRNSNDAETGDVLEDVRSFMIELVEAMQKRETTDTLLRRHEGVQLGKYANRGRKLPWLELDGGTVRRNSVRTGGADHELRAPSDIVPHLYRTAAADNLIRASRTRP